MTKPAAEYTPGRPAASFVIRLHGKEIPLSVEQFQELSADMEDAWTDYQYDIMEDKEYWLCQASLK